MTKNKKTRTPEQLQDLGRLTQGLLHNMNNSLASIVGFAEFLKDDIPKDSQSHAFADNIHKSGEHLKNMIKQLWMINGYSETMTPEFFEPVDLEELLESILIDLSEPVSKNLGLTLDYECEEKNAPYIIKGNYSYLKLAILEILNNAIESFIEKGNHHHDPNQNKILVSLQKDNEDINKIILEISDNGIGMDADCLDDCQEPFHSTKDPSLHHGLGLTSTKAILKPLNAYIGMESKKDYGTKVKIIFYT